MAARTSTRKVLASKMAAGQGGRVNVIGDDRTCPDCMGKKGQYKDKAGAPPYHPNCRCSLSS